MENKLRFIPKMDELMKDSEIIRFREELSDNTVLGVLREETENLRECIQNKGTPVEDRVAAAAWVKQRAIQRLQGKKTDRLKRVINATGVILHTNLGRAPLSREAAAKVSEVVSGYNNLEYSVSEGNRRSRMFYVEELLKELTGAEAALAVNNNAAAVFLAMRALCKGKEVILSRGEIVEIGDSFRISEIIRESGCILREAGATNRTNIGDYESLICENTAALLKIHRSNFRIVGFTGEAGASELVELSRKYPQNRPLVIEDMGSGILEDLSKHGMKYERTVRDALHDGVDVVTFSGDKVLGGPQAGVIAGKKKYVDLMRKNQMYRCLRLDKMCLAALEATLWQYARGDYQNIPVLKSLFETEESVHEKAGRLNTMLSGLVGIHCYAGPHTAMSGGGALPGEPIGSSAVFIAVPGVPASDIDSYLRNQTVPIIATITDGEVILDARTVDEGDFGYIRDVCTGLKDIART